MVLTRVFDVDSPATFDVNKIEEVTSVYRLKLIDNPSQTFNQSFANDTGFTYNALFNEFVGGVQRQKDTRPANALHYTSFTVDQNNVWPAGQNANSLIGGATVSGGVCDLTGASGKRLNMPGSNGFDAVGNAGCIRFSIISPYTGNPSATEQILEYDATTGNNNAIFISQNTGGNFIIDVRDSSGAAHQFVTSSVSRTTGVPLVCELNFDFSGTTRFYVDGTNRGSLNTSSWTRVAESGTFKWGGATGTGNFSIDDIIVFDAVQHTTDHAGELPYTYYETIYVGDPVTLPSFSYSGIGAVQAFTNFAATITGTTQFIMNNLWYSGGWVASDGTRAQSNTAAEVIANIGTLPASDTLDIKLTYESSNTQSSIDDLTVTYTGQIYPVDNPTVLFTTPMDMDSLVSVLASFTASGNDNVKATLSQDGVEYYWDGAAWSVSNGQYAQSSTFAEINTNAATFISSSAKVLLKIFLHSDDGSTTPTWTSTTVEYNFVVIADDVNRCVISGVNLNGDGSANTNSFKVRPYKNVVEYKDTILVIDDDVTVTPNASGEWTVSLIETVNMPTGAYYEWVFTTVTDRVPKDTTFKTPIPDKEQENFNDLTFL